MTDALGNKIEIDHLYGYSHRANDICTVLIGQAKKTQQGECYIRNY